MKVAVTGVGGGVGQSILKALQPTSHEMVGIDGDLLATGLYGVSSAYQGYYANTDKFLPFLEKVCDQEKVEVLFPGLDAELPYLAGSKSWLEKKTGTQVVVSSPSVVDIADDKLLTYEFLEKNGFPALETYKVQDYDDQLDFPVVVKPCQGGARSVGKKVIKDPATLEEFKKIPQAQNYVVQEYSTGKEYTCGTLFLDDFIGAIIMTRQLRCGDTYKAFVVQDEKIQDYLQEVIQVLNPWGPCNVQLRLKDGVPYIFEFNARCSGTTASRALAGFNEPLMVCDYLQGENIVFNIKEMAILRYWSELTVSYNQIEEMKLNRYLENQKNHLGGN
ncbi:ATP-grasp domain-containing protein [Methanobacterium alkalithermotolerans]|uniref:ATP-grasp domain-containing protein n=1 Tax=Methanobacterium alkalithermotolerans TaxID=2731220 RepID=A0A8T8K6B5_9EURY|nr:ATP-grasp domain-containing protein [Methanobacterium alkalithermotolerans]QUH22663.1 ATP-grasp domain-containing protein [Methanobacterium alkalithermotolerans]